MALLAKQGWRLCCEEDSLFFQIFKTKYFPDTSFLEAKSYANSSWAWQGILASKDLVAKGWRWNVANGKNIDIWKDPWLLDPLWRKILTPNPHKVGLAKVSDLIDPTNKAWRANLIKETFSSPDAEQILEIPISTTDVPDKRIWKESSSGKFMVKSAYVLAKEMMRVDLATLEVRGQTSGTSDDDARWKRVWHIKSPMKIKLFMWKCLHGIVPVNEALTTKKVPVDSICSLCGLQCETVDHMLFNCDRSSQVWILSLFQFQPEIMKTARFREMWYDVGEKAKGEDEWEVLGLEGTE